jgi:hypothetical protein
MKQLLRKKTEWNPEKTSDYAISKYGAEMEIWRSTRGDVNCKSRNYWPWFQEQGSGLLLKQLQTDYGIIHLGKLVS